MKSIGENIKKLRIKKNLTQKELANKLFICRQSISKWEKGLSYPQVTIINDLIKVLECTYEELFDF